MPKQNVMLEQVVFYRVSVNADTPEEAREKVQQALDDDDGEDLDLWEIDNSPFTISTNP